MSTFHYTVTISVLKHPDGTPVADADVWLQDSTQTAVIKIGTTDMTGGCVLSGDFTGVDTDSRFWTVYAQKSGMSRVACGIWAPYSSVNNDGAEAVLYLTDNPLPPAQFNIDVQVASNKNPVAGATVTIYKGTSGTQAGFGTTNNLGEVGIAGPLNTGESMDNWYAIVTGTGFKASGCRLLPNGTNSAFAFVIMFPN